VTIEEHKQIYRSGGSKIPVRIEIEYEDGSLEQATGDAAFQILNYWNSCEALAATHGGCYAGPRFEVLREGKG